MSVSKSKPARRRKNGAVGKTYRVDHIPAPAWGELVARPAPIARHPNRTPQHLLDLPTPESLAEFVESESHPKGNRQSRRARRARVERVARQRLSSLASVRKAPASLRSFSIEWRDGVGYRTDLITGKVTIFAKFDRATGTLRRVA